MSELGGNVGFTPPIAEENRVKRRAIGIELIATAALAIALGVAAAAISIGVVHPRPLAHPADGGKAPYAVAVLIGGGLAGIGGLTAIAARQSHTPRG